MEETALDSPELDSVASDFDSSASAVPDSSSVEDDSLAAELKASETYSKIILVFTDTEDDSVGTLEYYKKEDGIYVQELSVTAYVGRAGIGDASEYSTRTPRGCFTFTKLFGIASDPGTLMEYHQLDNNDYWCGEEYYNQFVDGDVIDHSGCSKYNDEHLINATDAYQYVAAFNYNPDNVEGEGFAFFLHHTDGNPYTEGCVATDFDSMRYLETEIDEDTCIIIDTKENLLDY